MANPNDGESLEEAAKPFISCSDELRRKIRIYCNLYMLWIQKREKTIASVKEIAATIDEDHKNVNIANLVGGSVAVVGGGMAIAGICLIPVTFGVSAALTGVGAAVGAGGGAAGAGAVVVDHFLRKKNFESAMDTIQSDRDETEQLAKTAEEINRLEKELQKVSLFLLQKMITDKRICPIRTEKKSNLQQWNEKELVAVLNKISDYLPDAVKSGKLSATTADRMYESITSFKKVPDFVVKLKVLIQGASAGRAILAGAGGILAGIGIALELVNIAITAVDVHRGSKTKEAKDLYDIAEELENELSRATDLFNEVENLYKCANK